MDPAVLHLELDNRHNQNDDEDDPGNGRTITDFKVTETGLPEIINHRHGRWNERLVIPVEYVNRLEDLQGIDESNYQVIENVRG